MNSSSYLEIFFEERAEADQFKRTYTQICQLYSIVDRRNTIFAKTIYLVNMNFNNIFASLFN